MSLDFIVYSLQCVLLISSTKSQIYMQPFKGKLTHSFMDSYLAFISFLLDMFKKEIT